MKKKFERPLIKSTAMQPEQLIMSSAEESAKGISGSSNTGITNGGSTSSGINGVDAKAGSIFGL